MKQIRVIARWLLLSLLVHAFVLVGLGDRAWTPPPARPPAALVMVEVPPPAAEAPPTPPRPDPPAPPPAPRSKARRKRRAPRRPATAPTSPPPERAEPKSDDSGGGQPDLLTTDGPSDWSHATGKGGTGGGTGTGTGTGTGAGHGPPRVREGRPSPSLSAWLDLPRLMRRALITPTTGLLMAVPGYRDVLRSTGIRPFTHLARLRVRLGGLHPRRLAVAGVHVRGRPAMRTATERTAATRGLVPSWKSADGVDASSWVDGSNIDRAVAITDTAFVVAARREMPKVLGHAGPSKRVARLSELSGRQFLTLRWQAPAHYLPGLSGCKLDSLRLSFADTNAGTGGQATLRARYASAGAARDAAQCLRNRQVGTPLQWLSERLTAARTSEGSRNASLTWNASSEALSEALEGIAWATRRQRHRGR